MIKKLFERMDPLRAAKLLTVFAACLLTIVMLTACGPENTGQTQEAGQTDPGESLVLAEPEETPAPTPSLAPEETPAAIEAPETEISEADGREPQAETGDVPEDEPEISAATLEPKEETPAPTAPPEPEAEAEITVEKNGTYISKEEVALYIHTYGRLPSNFISKSKAEDRGWNASEGNLDEVCPGKSIGGGRYNNYEKTLPKGKYRECDINYTEGFRGPERLVYSEDGRIYYTPDHYKTFEQLY